MANAEGITPLEYVCRLRAPSLVNYLLSRLQGAIWEDAACVTALLRSKFEEVSRIIAILKVRYL
jgi:hypothetical protein